MASASNGLAIRLKLIAEELLRHPEIALDWKEPGIAFRVTFSKKNFNQNQELQQESLYGFVLRQLENTPLNTKELSSKMGLKEISGQLRKVIRKLHDDNPIENSIPNNPNHPAQKYQIIQMGRIF